MATVGFKRGTKASLPSSGIVDGTFYLTTDTDELYIGKSGNKLELLNKTIRTVADMEALAQVTGSVGDFYYVVDGNILAIYKGGNDGWVQINPDTDTNTTNSSLSVALADVTGNSNVKKITVSVADSASNSVSDYFNIVGDGDVSVSQSGKSLTLSSAAYSLIGSTSSLDNGSIDVSLSQGSSVKGLVHFEAGTNVNFSGLVNASGSTPASVTINATDTKISDVSIANGSTSGFDITVTDTSTATDTANLNPQIKVDSGANKVFTGGVLDLTGTYYTKNQVDEKIKTYDAVEYRGTLDLSSATTLPTSSIKNGYMYMISGNNASTPVQINNVDLKAGDLIIATKRSGSVEEDSNGYLPSNGITWDHVPSGNDVDSTYTGQYVSNGWGIVSVTGGTGAGNSAGQITFANGNDISVNVAADQSDSKNSIVTVAHGSYNTVSVSDPSSLTNPANDDSFIIISEITNTRGHITGFTKQKIKAPIALDTFTESVATSNNVATVTSSLISKYGNGNTAQSLSPSFSIGGDGIKVTSSGTAITLSIEWGTFGS